MYRLILLFTAGILVGNTLKSQDNENTVRTQDNGYIALDYGFNYPTGEFKSTSVDNEKAGYAEKGKAISLTLAYKFSKHLGLTAIYRRQTNAMDVSNLQRAYEQIDPFLIWVVEAEEWKSDAFIIGPYGNFKFWDYIEVHAKLGTAIIKATTPRNRIRVSEPITKQYEYIEQEEATSNEFGMFLGGGIKFDIYNSVCFFINADYMIAKPVFETEVTSTFDFGGDIIFIQEMNSFTLGFGIGIRL